MEKKTVCEKVFFFATNYFEHDFYTYYAQLDQTYLLFWQAKSNYSNFNLNTLLLQLESVYVP